MPLKKNDKGMYEGGLEEIKKSLNILSAETCKMSKQKKFLIKQKGEG